MFFIKPANIRANIQISLWFFSKMTKPITFKKALPNGRLRQSNILELTEKLDKHCSCVYRSDFVLSICRRYAQLDIFAFGKFDMF